MLLQTILTTIINLYHSLLITALPTNTTDQHPQVRESLQSHAQWNHNISQSLFVELEELARIVDISYCVGTSGIWKPFRCASRCAEFPNFELVDTWCNSKLEGSGCGFLVLDHAAEGRILAVFRGTYSIADTIIDLSTIPQEYIPYPESPIIETNPITAHRSLVSKIWLYLFPGWKTGKDKSARPKSKKTQHQHKCTNCTVHMGFWTSWKCTRRIILPHLRLLREAYPSYTLHLIGHSMGGAVAGLAGLDLHTWGWNPVVTTFGEPRLGNAGLRDFVDRVFALDSEDLEVWRLQSESLTVRRHGGGGCKYRRVTHVGDPVPLLPLGEWGYSPHAGEVFIAKRNLKPAVSDLQLCFGDEDPNCIAGADIGYSWFEAIHAAEIRNGPQTIQDVDAEMRSVTTIEEQQSALEKRLELDTGNDLSNPSRFMIWQLVFAHRDYFSRLGLCIPGSEWVEWAKRKRGSGKETKDKVGDGHGDEDEESREL